MFAVRTWKSFSFRVILLVTSLGIGLIAATVAGLYLSSVTKAASEQDLANAIRGMSDLEVMRDAYSNWNRKLEVWGYAENEIASLKASRHLVPSSLSQTAQVMQSDFQAQYNTYYHAYKDMESLKKKDPQDMKLLGQLGTGVSNFRSHYVLPLMGSPTTSMLSFSTTGQTLAGTVSSYMDELLTNEQNLDVVDKNNVAGDFHRETVLSYTLLIIGVILSLFAIAYVYRSLRRIPILLRYVQTIAEGDLTSEGLDIKQRDEIGILAEAFNQMVNNLRRLLTMVDSSATQVVAGSEEISAATEQIASGSHSQAQSSETVNQLFKELSTAIGDVARNAEQAAEIASRTADLAANGERIVRTSVDGMNAVSEQINRLSDDSNRVGAIVEVINDIAEQTNLLALNAAIESARAGESGRGFAVVADEVRKLAERSSEATKQITAIIKTMQANTQASVKAVSEGVVSSQEGGQAFETIVSMVNASSDKVREIAAASEEQSAQATEVLSLVENIAAVSEEAAASSVATADASQALARLAQELTGYVKSFKIEG